MKNRKIERENEERKKRIQSQKVPQTISEEDTQQRLAETCTQDGRQLINDLVNGGSLSHDNQLRQVEPSTGGEKTHTSATASNLTSPPNEEVIVPPLSQLGRLKDTNNWNHL